MLKPLDVGRTTKVDIKASRINRPRYIALVDEEGYELHSFRVRAPNRTATILGGPPEGEYIAGKSGRPMLKPISNPNAWRSLLELDGPESLVRFQTEYGPLTPVDPSEKFFEPWNLLKPTVELLSALAKCADAYDQEGFFKLVEGRQVIVQRLGSLPSTEGRRPHRGLTIEFRSLPSSLIWQMWNACGEQDHPTTERASTCKHCGKMFVVGQARASGGRRVDARYCSTKCKDAESKRRKRAARASMKFECAE